MRRRPAAGVAAGAATLLTAMLGVAGVAVALGWLEPGPDGRPALAAWLRLEVAAGSVAGWLAGRVSRRTARDVRAPLLLAGLVFVLGAPAAGS